MTPAPAPPPRPRAPLLGLILALASALGLWALLAPFLAPEATLARRAAAAGARAAARAEDAPLLFLLLLGLCLVTVVAALETRRMDARRVAALGVLVAINAVLRLIPGPGGFNAIFLLPILCGYVFGPAFGFLLGSLSLVGSAVLANALGPWLPFEMLAAGWIGLASGWLPDLGRRRRAELALLAAWGAACGLLYGAVVNLWFWPFLAPAPGAGATVGASAGAAVGAAVGAAATAWQPGSGLAAAVASYGLFYLATSLWWDLGRAGGNLALVVLAGAPVLRLLRRFARRFTFRVDA
jgi:energy-coupling factor transport system substrate-specific component